MKFLKEAAILAAAFNWLTVFVLLPLEILFGMMFRLTALIVKPLETMTTSAEELEFDPIGVVTNPIKHLLIKGKGRLFSNFEGVFKTNIKKNL